MLDASGLVVAPGFIDLHAHGQETPAARMQAFDGVTTALELEAGTLPVAVAYDRVAKEGRPINYGFSASWLFARIAEKERMEPDGALTFFQDAQRRTGWQFTVASPDETARIIARVERGLQEGALGIGVLAGYAPGYGRKEAFAVAQLAARLDVPTFTHVRYMSVIEPQSSFEAMEEIVSLAAATGARMHIAHLNSSSSRDIPRIAELLRGAQGRGLRISTEAYPYGAGSTVVGAELFRGNWRERWVEPARATSNAQAFRSMMPRSPRHRRRRRATGSSFTSCVPIAVPPTRRYSTSRCSCPAGPSRRTRCRGRSTDSRSPATYGHFPMEHSRTRAARGLSRASCATTCASDTRSPSVRACVG